MVKLIKKIISLASTTTEIVEKSVLVDEKETSKKRDRDRELLK